MNIISLSSFDKSARSHFKSQKLALRDAGYPGPETKTFVMPYLGLVKSQIIKNVPSGSILISVPSTNPLNANPIPFIFAREASRFVDGSEAFNGNLLCQALHAEKKSNTSFESTPIPHYLPLEKLSGLASYVGQKPVFVMEDWASTGESALNFAKTLSNNGVPVAGVCALVVNEKYFPSAKDLAKNSDVLQRHAGISTKEADILVSANFAPFLRHKLSRFIMSDIHSSKDALLSSLRDKTAFYLKNNYFDGSVCEPLASYRQQNHDKGLSI